jgi:1-aminocyclopropane-1-carboxylate deaminase
VEATVSLVAARLGLRAVLVQESWVDWPDPVNDRVGNILLSRIMGADVRLVDEGFGIGFKTSWEQALEDARAAGGTPYAIPAGASDHRPGASPEDHVTGVEDVQFGGRRGEQQPGAAAQ